jgi:hypothetical protein
VKRHAPFDRAHFVARLNVPYVNLEVLVDGHDSTAIGTEDRIIEIVNLFLQNQQALARASVTYSYRPIVFVTNGRMPKIGAELDLISSRFVGLEADRERAGGRKSSHRLGREGGIARKSQGETLLIRSG